MEYRRLGGTGLCVSEVGLGANNFGWFSDEDQSIRVIDAALSAGVNFIDTADWYAAGKSEEIVGKAIRGRRDDVIVATKFGKDMGDGPNDRGGSRQYVLRAVEASLRRLGIDHIDLYQMHLPDEATPIQETLAALEDLVRSGKVRYVGCCNFAAWQLCEALMLADGANRVRFATIQRRYNLLDRALEDEVLPCARRFGVGVIPWGPLAAGFLTGKYRRGEKGPEGARLNSESPSRAYDDVMTEDNWDKLQILETYAAEHGRSVGELAVAWLLAHPEVSSVIAGARNEAQVVDNVAAASWRLEPLHLREIDALLSASSRA